MNSNFKKIFRYSYLEYRKKNDKIESQVHLNPYR